jgi:hypothetical protein
MHHIASDGWSLSVIIKELVELYGSYIEKRESRLKELPVQYADYAIWQRSYLEGEVLNKNLLTGRKSLMAPTITAALRSCTTCCSKHKRIVSKL